MKLVSLILIFFLFYHAAKSQTSLTEYNYITKGLVDDLGKGKDIKAGYNLVDLHFDQKNLWSDGSWKTIRLYSFNKDTTSKGIVVEFSDSKGHLGYKCIPAKNSPPEIFTMSITDFDSISPDWAKVLTRAFLKLAASKML